MPKLLQPDSKQAGMRALCEEGVKRTSDVCFIVAPLNGNRPQVCIKRKTINASRYVWALANGDPGEKFVLHTCHDAWCININHLYLGNHAKNMEDMVEAGNWSNGPSTTLTALKVNEIRKIGRETDRTYANIAEEFGVDSQTVSDVLKKRTWRI